MYKYTFFSCNHPIPNCFLYFELGNVLHACLSDGHSILQQSKACPILTKKWGGPIIELSDTHSGNWPTSIGGQSVLEQTCQLL